MTTLPAVTPAERAAPAVNQRGIPRAPHRGGRGVSGMRDGGKGV